MHRIAFQSATLALATALAACAIPSELAPAATPATVQTYVDRANALAGEDLRPFTRLCAPQPAERASNGADSDEYIRKLMARAAPPPMQVFDNLYYVGGDWVAAWLLKTSEGLILIDALNNEQEARDLIEGGMAKLGLDPRQIKYILVTHGHGDHYGGASYLAGKYGARVVASETDWDMMHTHLEFDSAIWGRPPARDIAVKDGDRLRLGDATLVLYETPGHSPGTLSPLLEVQNGGKRHKALLWGGTSFNFGKDFGRLKAYADSAERLRRVTAEYSVDILLSNHSSFDNAIPKMRALAASGGKGSHPFVTGPLVVDRAFQIMSNCARAQTDRFRL